MISYAWLSHHSLLKYLHPVVLMVIYVYGIHHLNYLFVVLINVNVIQIIHNQKYVENAVVALCFFFCFLNQLQDNAADFAITTLRFLDKRMVSNMNNSSIGANLISCGGVGFVRFWNVHVGKLLGEYQAHIDGILMIK